MQPPPILSFQVDVDAGVHVDLDKLLAHKLAVQGNSGSGKSWLLRTLLEQTHGAVQHSSSTPKASSALYARSSTTTSSWALRAT